MAGVRHFLENYQTRILFPLELPATARACALAACRRSQELISLDQQLCWQPSLSAFACASRRIGRAQLHCLSALRDERMVRRYLLAVAQGKASGWHMIVYGLTLALYSHPLRQGLMHYARQTLTGLARAAARSQSLPELACADILQFLFRRLPEAIDRAALEFIAVEGLPADALIQC
jgi:urease accessory protein UreF